MINKQREHFFKFNGFGVTFLFGKRFHPAIVSDSAEFGGKKRFSMNEFDFANIVHFGGNTVVGFEKGRFHLLDVIINLIKNEFWQKLTS